MAMYRRSIIAGAGAAARRINRPLPRILACHDDDSVHPIIPKPAPIQCTINYSSPFRSNSNERSANGRNFLPYSTLPFALRGFASSANDTNAEALVNVPTSAPVPAPVTGEVAAAAADSFPPVAALQYLIDWFHCFTGLDWWASIALTTLLIRSATIPLLIKQRKATVKLSMIRPELQALGSEIENSRDPQSVQEGLKKVKSLFKMHGVTPFTPFTGLLIQGPIFLSFYFAISSMAEKVPSFKDGGILWFTDLTTPDALYIFPILTSLTFLATVEFNTEDGLEGNPVAKKMKNAFRVLAFLAVPLTSAFPKAIFCYWISSNMFSLVYGLALKHPAVLKHLNIPVLVSQSSSRPQLQENAFHDGSDSLSIRNADRSNSPERKVASSAASERQIEKSRGS